MRSILRTLLFILIAISIFFSCQKETNANKEPENFQSNIPGQQKQSKKIYVSSASELYAALNDPDNAGSAVVLSPGTYMLSPNYPNGGRVELQYNMSLIGQPGHPELVVIDATNLPLSSFTIAPTNLRTGVVRMGNGSNAIEWITFQNNPDHTIRSLIQTDIVGTPTTKIRIAHCVIKGSSIGMSIINRESRSNGRIIEAEIEDNELMDNTIPQFGSGIQIQNSMGVSDAVIRATLRRNYIHGNKAGMLAFNASSQRSLIEIKSYDDRIENNGIGLMFNGGFIESTSSANNSLSFEAHATSVQNNSGIPIPPFSFPAAGVHAAGGQAMPPFAAAGIANYNKLEISFHGCNIKDNAGNFQINAYGAHSFHPSLTPAGIYNSTAVYLYGLSANSSVNSVSSFPTEPAGTNTVNIYK
jgi:hypothetical protein